MKIIQMASKLLPNELIIIIFRYTKSKINMITTFPWLKHIVNKCEYCDEKAYFIVKFTIKEKCNSCTRHELSNKGEYTTDDTYLCKLNCPYLYYQSIAIILEPSLIDIFRLKIYNINKNFTVTASYLCERDNCSFCDRFVTYTIKADGLQLII